MNRHPVVDMKLTVAEEELRHLRRVSVALGRNTQVVFGASQKPPHRPSR